MAKFSNASGSLFLNLYLDISGEPNIANNSSNVAWRVTVSRTGAYLTYNESGSSTLSVDINGSRVNTSNPRWSTSGQEVTLASGTTTITHDANGSKTISASATFNPDNGVHGVITTTGSLALPTIPRTSSLSFGAITLGSAVTLNVARSDSSFTHTIRYEWGSTSGTIATNVATSTSWIPPLSLATHIPNNTSGVGTLYIDTLSGTKNIGTKSYPFIATLPTSVKPTFTSLTLTDANTAARALLSGNNFLQIISNIQVTFNGHAGTYGSTITGFRAELVNKNQGTNSNGGSLGIMNFNGSATIRASVVDSRGRWSDTKDVTINVIEYFAPILSFTALRTRETPNIVQIVRNAKIAPITLSGNQKNIMTLTFKVAPLGSTSYTADNGSASGSWTTQHTLSNSAANMAGNYPANKSFTIIGTLSDKFTSVEFSATVATESVVMSYDKDGRVGVGKIVENGPAGSLDVAGNIYAGGKQIQQYQLTNVEGNTIYAYNTDVNTHVNNGTRWINPGCANSPFPSQYGWIETYRATTDIFQIARSWSGGWKVYRRHANNYKSSNGSATWYPWVEITPQTNHTNLINTGWQSAGYPGTYYKRVGDVLTIKYDFTGNGSTMNIGSIPSDIWVAPQSYMLVIAKWSISGSDNSHVQINQGTGALNVLSTGNGIVYRGQLTIMI